MCQRLVAEKLEVKVTKFRIPDWLHAWRGSSRLSGSFRAPLVGLVAAVTVPFLLTGGFLAQSRISTTQSQIAYENQTIELTTADEIDKCIANTAMTLRSIVSIDFVQGQRLLQTETLLQDILPLHPELANLYAIDTNGLVYASAAKQTFSWPYVYDRAYFREVIRTQQVTVSDSIIDSRTMQPVVVVAIPLYRSDGRLVGALAAAISLENLSKRVNALATPPQRSVVVVDSAGTVVSHPKWNMVSGQANLRSMPPINAGLNRQMGTDEYKDLFGSATGTVLASYGYPRNVPWAVMVSASRPTTLESAIDIIESELSLLGVATLVASLLVVILYRTTVLPRYTLAHAAVDMDNQSATSTHSSGGDEVRKAVSEFRAIRSDLLLRTQELSLARAETDRWRARTSELLQGATNWENHHYRQISLDLHDGPIQYLSAAGFEVQRVYREVSGQDPAMAVSWIKVRELIDRALQDMRSMVYDVYPSPLDGKDLLPSLEEYVQSYSWMTDLNCVFDYIGTPYRLSQYGEIAVFRIVQEGLHNVRKHARASQAHVSLAYEPDKLVVRVVDDGRGFETSVRGMNELQLGLTGMEQRALWIGAKLSINSVPMHGTELTLEIPLDAAVGSDHTTPGAPSIHRSPPGQGS